MVPPDQRYGGPHGISIFGLYVPDPRGKDELLRSPTHRRVLADRSMQTLPMTLSRRHWSFTLPDLGTLAF